VGLGGIFETPVNMVRGATQAAEAFGYRASAGFKPETLTMQPELAAVRMPGLGAALVQRLGWYSHAAVWVAQTRARAQGTVKEGWLGGTRVQYSLGESDVAIARNACGVLARLLFEAGAREVWPGIHGVPAVLQSMDDVRHIDAGPLDPRAYAFVATHLFGAARMGRDVGASVVGTDFESHEVERLYVVDSSVFPTNLGVNPQHTIMAMARLAAFGIAERGLRRAA
jgi:choline dehydrogenase-like flavoprotein